MARATLDPETDQTVDENDAETNKRERVDLEALQPLDKVIVAITVPAEMKLALLKQAEDKQINITTLARDFLANAIGYTVPDEFTKRTRKSKYSHLTPDERKKMIADNAKKQRDHVRDMLKLLEANPELKAQLESQMANS